MLKKGEFLSLVHSSVVKPYMSPGPVKAGEEMEPAKNGKNCVSGREDSKYKGLWVLLGVGCLRNTCRLVWPERRRRVGLSAEPYQEPPQKEFKSDAKKKKKLKN